MLVSVIYFVLLLLAFGFCLGLVCRVFNVLLVPRNAWESIDDVRLELAEIRERLDR